MKNKAINNTVSYSFTGTHIIAELYGILPGLLNSIDRIENAVSKGIAAANVRCEGVLVKKFAPTGVTLLALLLESHVSVHTYPEDSALFFDAFTCGSGHNPEVILKVITEELAPIKSHVQKIRRGYDSVS